MDHSKTKKRNFSFYGGKNSRRIPLSLKIIPFATLVTSLLFALFLWEMFDNSLIERSQAIYADMIHDISSPIIGKMYDSEQVLRGAAGLFSVKENVDRADWRHYVSALQLGKNHPGILGVGFSKWLTPQEKEANVRKIRSDGFSEYVISPEGKRSVYTSIVYLEPFNQQNQRTFGYDMYSEPVCRAAMDKARDGNVATIAAKIILVQEIDKDKQSGMLMFVPVYRQGMSIETVEQRHKALIGFVYIPIRMNDFVTGALVQMSQDIAFDIRVSGSQADENLIFSSILMEKNALPEHFKPLIATSKTIHAYGCSWQFTFKALPGFNREFHQEQSYLVLFTGIVFSILVSYVVVLLLKTRNQAIRLAADKISQLDQRLTLATDSAHIGVWDYLVPEKRLIWDKWMFALYGIQEDDFDGAYEAWQNGLHPDDKVRGDKEIDQALRGEKEFDTEFRVVWPTGELRHIKATALVIRDDAGNPLRMIGMNYDITKFKQLESVQHKLSRAVEQSPVGIIITDVRGKIEYVNPFFTKITGYTVDEAIGQNPRVLQSGQTPPETYSMLWQTILSGQTWKGDFVNKGKNGVLFWEQATISPLTDEFGTITHFVAVKEDVTEKKRILAELVTAKELAETANFAKSDFLANMSHEIRTPMNGVIGMTGLLLETELSDEQRRYAETVRNSGESLLHLINDILDFSKIEAGKIELETLNFNLSSLLDDFSATLAVRAHEKGLELICAVAPDVPAYLRGDPGRLRQILTNLVGNAVKFTHQGGISVQASLVSETYDKAMIRFSIKDTGIGIPVAKQELLFQKFTQIDTSTVRRYGGTGLGLSISKELAELMGGEIGVTPEEGRGSEFWFTVHMGKQTDPSLTVVTRYLYRELRRRPCRILLAEDNITNQQVALAILKKMGLRADVVANGTEAIMALETLPYDLVLMDLQMPEMDGVEATRHIRNSQSAASNHGIPIIAMTAHTIKGDREHCLEAGMNDYVTKPIYPHTLAEALDKWLPKDTAVSTEQAAPEPEITSSVTAREPQSLVYDRDGLMDRLEDEGLVRMVTECFLEDMPRLIEMLRACLEAGDAPGAERQAHTIKGAAANVGGETLRKMANEMEKAGKAGDLDAVRTRMADLGSRFDQLRQAMAAGR